MILLIFIIAAVLIIAGLRNTQTILADALIEDVPGYLITAAAIFAIGAIGFIPKLSPISRALLGLVLLVIVLKDYTSIISGFQNAWQNAGKIASTSVVGGGSQSASSGGLGGFGGSDTTALLQGYSGASGSSGGSGSGGDIGTALQLYEDYEGA